MAETVHIVCPHCDAINRVPRDKLGAGGKCGKCHQPLFDGHPTELTGANFTRHIGQGELPVLVDFWAPWCGPCKMMAPIFEQAAGELQPEVQLAKVNTENEQGLAAQFGIRSIPTLVLFKDGREAARLAGATDLSSLVGWTRQHL